METAIQSRDLTKTFPGTRKQPGTVAVNRINLMIRRGEVFGLLGPNGAGKTTTVRMLTCLIRPTSGEAWIEGASTLSEPMKVRARCGVLTEAPGLYARLNAMEYLSFFGQLYGLSSKEVGERIPVVLDLLGIAATDRKRLGQFSRGMQQKMGIARAILHDPAVLFLDEPTASLDPESAKAVRDYILAIKAELNHTIVLCTHNLAEADRICDRIGIIHKGDLLRVGKPDELKAHLGQHRTYSIRLAGPVDACLAVVRDTPGVKAALVENGEIVFHTDQPETANPQVVCSLVRSNAQIVSISENTHSLEEVYFAVMREQKP